MSSKENQLPASILEIIKKEKEDFYATISIQEVNKIQTANPIKDQLKWFKVKDVVCVYVDMIGSTRLSAEKRQASMAKIYKLFTQTIVKIFHEMEAPYISIQGDGVFALFNYDQCYRAFVSAIHIKTFIEEDFSKLLKNKVEFDDIEKNIGAHMGIDQGTLLVRRIGIRSINDDRDNEVWAGKTVNMAAKLASLSEAGELIVSDRFYEKIDSDYARMSCDCGEKVNLWKQIDVSSNEKFDFDYAYKLQSKWCENCGTKYATEMLKLDD